MLCINPSERITVDEALRHSFFTELHDPYDEPICESPFYVEHEIDNLPMKILKRKILRNSCLNTVEKKSYYSSEESLFKDFDEVISVDYSQSYTKYSNVKLNSRGDETDFSDPRSSVESCTSRDMCIPSLKDAMSREEIVDEPYRDPGVCERKYHDTVIHEIPTVSVCDINDNRLEPNTNYFSDLSPVIDISEPIFPSSMSSNQHFLEIHGRMCASSNEISKSKFRKSKTGHSLKSLNEEILRTLNKRACSNTCKIEDLMSRKMSRTSNPVVHWDSIRFWI